MRSAKRHSLVELKPGIALDVGEEVPTTEMLASGLEIIDTLPSKQQMVLRLKHLEGMEVEYMSRLALRIGGDYVLASSDTPKPIINEQILRNRVNRVNPMGNYKLRPIETYREYNM